MRSQCHLNALPEKLQSCQNHKTATLEINTDTQLRKMLKMETPDPEKAGFLLREAIEIMRLVSRCVRIATI